MIKSLRRKVFWSILLSAAGVLLVILVAINCLRLAQTASKRESVLDMALMLLMPAPGPGGGPKEGFPARRDDRAEMIRSVSEDELGALMLSAEGEINEKIGCAGRMEEDVLNALTAAALADADGRGSKDGWEYKVSPLGEGRAISLLNAASLRRENLETALLSLGAFVAACCFFALLARLLSRAIVKPVEDNVEDQKRFVADASHELKTPLAVIDANVSVLEESMKDNKWLGYIKEQSDRMAELVNQLLQLSHLEEDETAETPLQPEVFDAAEAVMAGALPFESMAFERGLKLETELPESLPVTGVRQDLMELTSILTDNAIKHASEGGTVRLSLGQRTARRGLKEEKMLELEISNPGKDIPPEALEHLFDRFYQVDPSRSHQEKSYGLGLAIAKKLAERNGGDIFARSGGGQTGFTLLLPFKPARNEE